MTSLFRAPLALTLLLVIALALRVRWPNIVGILGRAATAGLFLALGLCGGAALRGFLWLALLDGAFAFALAVSYFRLFRAEIMSRP